VNCYHFAVLGKMVSPDFVDLNKIAAGDDLPPPAKRELLTNCKRTPFCWLHPNGAHHPGDITAMVPESRNF